MKEYCDIPQEAAWYVADQKPGAEWPQHGYIIFRDFQTRYRHNLGLVLRKVDCNISRGEKVGIVGRYSRETHNHSSGSSIVRWKSPS
ncbi:unnamed protein product [Allacma fusca]|uniref:Uncharacterized protein n=1 Tax=Allacma fusca TaxID=39272 RepID=A0A8J2PJ34_9HEXA|nr:unnamed protein product [Allacma fusca]